MTVPLLVLFLVPLRFFVQTPVLRRAAAAIRLVAPSSRLNSVLIAPRWLCSALIAPGFFFSGAVRLAGAPEALRRILSRYSDSQTLQKSVTAALKSKLNLNRALIEPS
jgi:hypothetical protein